jgi:hypothetical protein
MVRLEGGCETGHKPGQWHMHEEPFHDLGRQAASIAHALPATPASSPPPDTEALWTDPKPRTKQGRYLWALLTDGRLDRDRDLGQRICQIENEAAALEATPPDSGSWLPPDPAPLDAAVRRWVAGNMTDEAIDMRAYHTDPFFHALVFRYRQVAALSPSLSGEAPSPVAEPRE